jgi:serine/threonine protein kinase/tetratricopeptide (TPR) repeat protein
MTQLGPFILERELGAGGMATVWRAHHRRQGTPVALKVITARLAHRERYLRAFRSEIQAAARLHHPGIVTVYDEGVVPTALGVEGLTPGSPYYAMELIGGEPLSQAAHLFGSWTDTRDFLLRLLDALAHAHARGVVHRDLKPDNILVTRDAAGRPMPHILDFGIAHALGIQPDPDIDEFDNSVTGTPRYMAPEQIGGTWREQGPWTDLYSLGVLTFALVAGQVPFDGESAIATLQAHLNQPVPPLNPRFAVPEHLEAWVARMLTKHPHERFRRAADAAYALFRLGSIVEPQVVSPTIVSEPMPGHFDDNLPTLAFERDHVELGTASGAFRGLGDESSEWRESMMRRVAPPVPMSWQRNERTDGSMHLHGAGLGLFDLRTIPLVGRERERTLLWNELRHVHEHGELRVVHLDGPAGVGKSRIIEWVAERAEEVGAAQFLRVVHDRTPGPYDGFAGTIARYHRIAGLSRGEASARVLHDLEALEYPADVRLYDSVALAEIALEHASEDPQRVRFAQPSERWVVYRRWLEHLAARRPVLLAIDNLQWSPDSVGFVESLIESSAFPMLVATTTRDDARALHAEVARRISAIDAADRVVATRVEPLSEANHRAFVASLVGLEDSLASSLAARTAGNPLFAMQLVSDWVERGLLVAGERGFELSGEMPPIPEGLHEAWIQRLEVICDEAWKWRALEVAAALGPSFAPELWAEAVGANVTPLLDELVDAHLLERRNTDSGVVSFTHTMLPEALERRAREADTWAEVNAMCAEALAARNRTDPASLGRFGRHALAAGQPDRAIAPLYRAAFWWMEGEEHERAGQFARMLERALDDLGASASHPDRLRARLLEGWILERAGDHRAAVEICRETRASIEQLDPVFHDELMGRALRLLAKLERRQSLERSTESARQAVELLQRHGRELGELGKATLAYAWNLGRMGQLDAGIDGIADAVTHFRAHGDPRWLAIAYKSRGYLLAQRGDLDDAVAAVEEARRFAEDVGDRSEIANTHNSLGEFARFREDWGEARRHYDTAESIERVTGGINLPVYRFNRLLCDIGEEQFDRAAKGLREMVDDWHEIQRAGLVANILMASVACHAARREWASFDRDVSHAERELEMSGLVDRDIAWCAEIAERYATEVGEHTRARIVRRIAEHQRDAMDAE